MGRDLQNISQYQLTNDIVKNHYVFDIKDGALKVLLLLSTHYPNILINRKSLMKRYKMAEKTVDRALKELSAKNLINRHDDGQITLNVTVIYSHIDGTKVVTLNVPCNNQHHETEKDNKQHDVVVDLLKGFFFSDEQIHHLIAKHSIESLQTYAKYVQLKNAENPKKYLLWCLKEKPVINNQPEAKSDKPKNDAERYSKLLNASTPNWMNSLQHAETFLANTTQFDLKNESILKDCIAIMLNWRLSIQDYNTLMVIDDAAANNEAFRQKTIKLTAQIMEDLKTAKMTVDMNGLDKEQIAC